MLIVVEDAISMDSGETDTKNPALETAMFSRTHRPDGTSSFSSYSSFIPRVRKTM